MSTIYNGESVFASGEVTFSPAAAAKLRAVSDNFPGKVIAAGWVGNISVVDKQGRTKEDLGSVVVLSPAEEHEFASELLADINGITVAIVIPTRASPVRRPVIDLNEQGRFIVV